MSKFRDVPYSVYGHSSWEQFWSNNNPDGKKPKPSTGGGYPKIDKRKFKKDVLQILEKMQEENMPIMDFEKTKAKLQRAIGEGDQ